MINTLALESSLFEMGRLYYEKGDLKQACAYLTEAKREALSQNKTRAYFDICQMLIRSYVEMEKNQEIQDLKKELQTYVLEENVEMTSLLYYTLGVCAYLDQNFDNSLTFFNQAFNIALAESNKKGMCYALAGKAVWYKANRDYEKALSFIENLKVFFESVSSPMVEVSAYICEAQIYIQQKRFDEANDVLWKAYNTSKKSNAVQFMIPYVLVMFSSLAAGQKHYKVALNYLDLAKGMIDIDVLKRLAGIIEECRAKYLSAKEVQPDIKININNHTVEEATKGDLELNNQFILLELLVEFVKKKGSYLTKADLADILWNQNYDPLQHDNKIYVTVRRLRKVLEPDPKNPKYILRTKEGYQLNPKTEVEIVS